MDDDRMPDLRYTVKLESVLNGTINMLRNSTPVEPAAVNISHDYLNTLYLTEHDYVADDVTYFIPQVFYMCYENMKYFGDIGNNTTKKEKQFNIWHLNSLLKILTTNERFMEKWNIYLAENLL